MTGTLPSERYEGDKHGTRWVPTAAVFDALERSELSISKDYKEVAENHNIPPVRELTGKFNR